MSTEREFETLDVVTVATVVEDAWGRLNRASQAATEVGR